MTVSGVATRYAQALVDALADGKSVDDARAALDGLNDFAETLKQSRDLDLILLSPAVTAKQKHAVLRKIADAMGLDKLVLNFLLVLVDHRRVNILREILEEAAGLLDLRLGFERADVTSAVPLGAEQRDAITACLQEYTGKTIQLKTKVDPELIGGVIAQVGSKVYDGSVRGRLQSIRERLTSN